MTWNHGVHESDMDGTSLKLHGTVAIAWKWASLAVSNGVACKHCQPVSCVMPHLKGSGKYEFPYDHW